MKIRIDDTFRCVSIEDTEEKGTDFRINDKYQFHQMTKDILTPSQFYKFITDQSRLFNISKKKEIIFKSYFSKD